MAEFKMPSLGADMDAGRLLEWYVKPGDAVKRGDIVALVDTDKAAIEVEIFEDGVVGELLVPPGEEVPVGTPLATLLPPGSAVEAAVGAPPVVGAPATAPPAQTAAVVGAAEAVREPSTPVPSPPTGAPSTMAAAVRERSPTAATEALAVQPPEGPRATPAARNHARAMGVDLRTVAGTGKHGVVTCQDVDAAAAATAAAPPAGAPAAPTVPFAAPTAEEAWVRASPSARRLAEELGVELATVRGTGPGGAVTRSDVEAVAGAASEAAVVGAAGVATEAATPAPREAPAEAPAVTPPAAGGATAQGAGAQPPAPTGDERYAAMRRAIAAAMSKSKREIPHYYLSLHVDMRTALAWLEETNLQRSVTERLLPAALLLKAAALATHDVPDVNGFYRDGAFEPSGAVHLGVGISLRQGGLIAPAIHDADRKDLDTLMRDLRDLVKRARSLQLRSSEMTDATLTTTMLGDQGVESVFGVIYPPQVALVGFGRIIEGPCAENGMLGVRPQIHITLAADHRASDGHRGGLYLSAIERLLQHPEEL